MKKDFGFLQKTVIDFSESGYWQDAVDEWDILDCSIDDEMKEICICGHEGFRYCFTFKVVTTTIFYTLSDHHASCSLDAMI